MDHELAAKPLRERLGGVLGGLAGRQLGELAALVVAHDPVVEVLVRRDMDGGDGQGLRYSTWRGSGMLAQRILAALMVVNSTEAICGETDWRQRVGASSAVGRACHRRIPAMDVGFIG